MDMSSLKPILEFLVSLFSLLFEALDEEIIGIDVSGLLGDLDLGDLGIEL
ncbi:MAG: hypothetical protein IKM24_05975 [Clostridia bacterium]|nr:hypothetical protein [Clostridia bacterium]